MKTIISVIINTLFFISIALVVLSMLGCNGDAETEDYQSIISKRKDNISMVLESGVPVILSGTNNYGISKARQKLILDNPTLKQELYFENGKPLLNEVLSISKPRPADITKNTTICKKEKCVRIEIYNYAYNGTAIITALEKNNKIVDFVFHKGMQGNVSESLTDLAMAIAMNDTLVSNAYGEGLDANNVRMQATKTALNKSKCQRSHHLCVAPTFVKGDKALWVVVDLTDLKVVGVKWTNVGTTGMVATERELQNDNIMKCYCEVENSLEQDNWKIKYNLTRSDGIKLYDVFFKNKAVIQSIKMVDWHVSYSSTQGFGYSDAIGCPEFSQAAVIAIEEPTIEYLMEGKDTLGFSLVQNYFSPGWPSPCSYNYQQKYEFFRDGSFRPVIGSLGRGCGINGTYRPVTRMVLFGDSQQFSTVDKKGQLKAWTKEGWILEDDLYDYYNDDFIGKWESNSGQNYMIEANKGQFGDNSRGDNAYVYVTVNHFDKDEGESDMPTIGPCCNIDHKQGPDKFINDEKLKDESLVVWYVPKMENDNRLGKEYCWAESVLEKGVYVSKVYPCFSGPKFIPIN